MLFPVRICEPDPVGVLQLLALQGGEKLIGDTALGIIAQVVSHPRKNQSDEHGHNNEVPAAAIARLVVLLRIHQRHDLLSIMESAEEEKVPTAALTAL